MTFEQKQILSENDFIQLPALALPSFRTAFAVQRGIERNIIIKTWGGVGDQICTEPTLRFALNSFKECRVSLASELPELFGHLKFHEVFDLRKHQPLWENYFPFNTIHPVEHIQWEFMSHMLVNCVDYPSLCAFRCMLPIKDKELICVPDKKSQEMVQPFLDYSIPKIVLHPGKHWQSKTFPAEFWNKVIETIKKESVLPILIGANLDDNRGTVDVNADGCLDLRGRLSLMESIALLQKSKVLLTNDSSPLHMAATGDAWIGFIATCKHPDYIMHWRRGEFGWREKNHGRDGIWNHVSYCPNQVNELSAENVGDKLIDWLPDPVDFAKWGLSKC